MVVFGVRRRHYCKRDRRLRQRPDRTLTGSVSKLARERQAKRLTERAAAVDALAKNEAFLIMSLIRSTALIAILLACIMLFLLAPMFGELLQTLCVFVPNDPECGYRGKRIALFGSAVFVLLSIYAGFKVSSTVKTTMSGYRAFRKQRGFPPVR